MADPPLPAKACTTVLEGDWQVNQVLLSTLDTSQGFISKRSHTKWCYHTQQLNLNSVEMQFNALLKATLSTALSVWKHTLVCLVFVEWDQQCAKTHVIFKLLQVSAPYVIAYTRQFSTSEPLLGRQINQTTCSWASFNTQNFSYDSKHWTLL